MANGSPGCRQPVGVKSSIDDPDDPDGVGEDGGDRQWADGGKPS